MSKHTPGPWAWGEDYCGLYGASKSNEVMTHQRFEGMWLSYGESQEANARLIAAAPDLLEALEALLNAGRGTSGRIILDAEDESLARAAIAKARGEA